MRIATHLIASLLPASLVSTSLITTSLFSTSLISTTYFSALLLPHSAVATKLKLYFQGSIEGSQYQYYYTDFKVYFDKDGNAHFWFASERIGKLYNQMGIRELMQWLNIYGNDEYGGWARNWVYTTEAHEGWNYQFWFSLPNAFFEKQHTNGITIEKTIQDVIDDNVTEMVLDGFEWNGEYELVPTPPTECFDCKAAPDVPRRKKGQDHPKTVLSSIIEEYR